MRPGGLLLLVVPNDFNLLQAGLRLDGKPAWWVVPGQHVNYFNPGSLHALVRRCGFSVGHVTATFPMELFVFMGLDYVNNPDVGRTAHAMRKRMELMLERLGLGDARRELYRALGLRGVGRDIVMLARKPGTQTEVAA